MKILLAILPICVLLISLPAQAGWTPPRVRPSIPRLSWRANLRWNRKIERIPKLVTRTVTNVPRKKHPKPATFQIQRSPNSRAETASACAIQIGRKRWGVAAGHAMKNVRDDPYVKVEVAPHTYKMAPIKKFYIGNTSGMDLALFEIPEEVDPFVTPLEPATRRSVAGETVNIPGFADGQPLFVPNEKILFTNSARMLIQRTPLEDLTGFCGSPVFGKNNTVVAIYSGFVKKDYLRQFPWFYDLPLEVQWEMPNLHLAIPIENVEIMAEGAEAHSLQQAGKMMKAFNHPIAPLHPNEEILTVEQFRNGEKIAKFDKNYLVDPEKLEETFEWEENDVLRVILKRPQTPPHVIYDINVSTGEVFEVPEKDAFTPELGR